MAFCDLFARLYLNGITNAVSNTHSNWIVVSLCASVICTTVRLRCQNIVSNTRSNWIVVSSCVGYLHNSISLWYTSNTVSNTHSNWMIVSSCVGYLHDCFFVVNHKHHVKHTLELSRLCVGYLHDCIFTVSQAHVRIESLSLCALAICTTVSLRYHKLKLCQTHAQIVVSLCVDYSHDSIFTLSQTETVSNTRSNWIVVFVRQTDIRI